MSELKNPRHEAFCKEYRRNGFNGLQAYNKVYGAKNNKTNEVNATRLLSNAKIKQRLAELSKKASEEYKYTVEKLVKELDEIEELAKQPIHGKDQNNYDLTNWIKIKSEKAKLFGLYAPTKTDNKTEISGELNPAHTQAINNLTKAINSKK
jgi:hypothetical protein